MKIRLNSNVDEKDRDKESVTNFREAIMHPFAHLRTIDQDASDISAGDRCHAPELLRRPGIEQDKREHETDTSLQRQHAWEPAGEQREAVMAQQVRRRQIQLCL